MSQERRDWWEIGEHLAAILWPFALFPCQCEARRRWANIQGERLWKWLDFSGYCAVRRRFLEVAMLHLAQRPTGAADLHATINRSGVTISRHSMERWLERLPVAWLTQHGERLYGLPEDR